MITLGQLKALVAISSLGTFDRAARRLNMTQSAISKRVQELEATAGIALFDRSQRGAKLTEEGQLLVEIASRMLNLEEEILSLKDGATTMRRSLRVGVTELTAITWLPRLITRLRHEHPLVTVIPEVDVSPALHSRLADDSLDIIVIPDVFTHADIISAPLLKVPFFCLARPGLVPPAESISLDDLAEYPFMTHGLRSGSGLFFNKWFKTEGIILHQATPIDSVMAMVGLAVAGLGIAHLPQACFQPLLDEGKLELIPITNNPPPLPFSACFQLDQRSGFIARVAEMMQEECDFSRQFQG